MTDEKQYIIPAGVNVFDHLRSKEVYISAPCGGHGTCGKCKIRLHAGVLPPGESDLALLSEDEINTGIRLACRAKTVTPVRISVPYGPGGRDAGSEDDFFQTSSDFDLKQGIFKEIEPSEKKQDYVFSHDAEEMDRHRGQSFPMIGNSITNGHSDIKNEDMDISHKYGIAVDIGTTTLAAAFTDMTLGKVLVTRTSVNRQRVFGSDVVSRTEAALSGKGEDLKRIIERDLCELIESLGIPDGVNVSKMVIAGNTTMYHLFMEYDVRGISSYPFEPVSLGGEWFLRDEIFSLETVKRNVLPESCRIYLMPGLSTFVGGDIFSGLSALGITEEEGNVFFIDIGTNAEMVLKKGDKYYTASAAAGPALEGGNLKWGTGSVAGAICGVEVIGDEEDRNSKRVPFDYSAKQSLHRKTSDKLGEPFDRGCTEPVEVHPSKCLEANSEIKNKTVEGIKIATISDTSPVGICGTGALEAVYEFLRAGIINEYGTYTEEYLESGFPLAKSAMGEIIGLDQDDIRQIQMAKAAIRAGAEVLLEHAGVTPEELDRVYVSGGFGSFLDMKKAAGIGILPEAMAEKAQAVGNTSLKGAVRVLSETVDPSLKKQREFDGRETLQYTEKRETVDRIKNVYERVTENAELLDLANDEGFKEKYIEYMNFRRH